MSGENLHPNPFEVRRGPRVRDMRGDAMEGQDPHLPHKLRMRHIAEGGWMRMDKPKWGRRQSKPLKCFNKGLVYALDTCVVMGRRTKTHTFRRSLKTSRKAPSEEKEHR